MADIIRGKQLYVESRVPGVTAYAQQNSFGIPSVKPTFAFLLNELRHGEDVEITLGYFGAITQGRIGGHALTLTGLKWTDDDMNGNVDFGEATMTFIDPATGQPGTKMIYFTFFNGGYLGTDYGMGGNVNCGNPPAPCRIQAIIIEAAVSESPVLPAPATLLMLASGLAGLGLRCGTRWLRQRIVSASRTTATLPIESPW
ncbi:MAG TPA: hypothetical protein VGT00_16020 [Methylomirabilota bacterium]|nr:hypothetical protein [Methylomirabilota bacterium]